MMMMMIKLPILPCAEKLELVLSAAGKTEINNPFIKFYALSSTRVVISTLSWNRLLSQLQQFWSGLMICLSARKKTKTRRPTRSDSQAECAARRRRERPRWLCPARWNQIAAPEFGWNWAERSCCRWVDWTAPDRGPSCCFDQHHTACTVQT